ncbi:5321_t:CDS:2 [Dentiscutata heterogama]|uniref:5321_t:CDS:1 n=1 Tax=Dentiscutata heterogama TaxID=1316150 RepID=A0ACA9KZ99_9GLOM|nr:5321_t:CDS:2 [Dentiscutata heterogama]
MKLVALKGLALASQTKQQEIYRKYSFLTLKIDKNIAKYLGYENPD